MLTDEQVREIEHRSATAHQHASSYRDGAKAQQAVAALLADRRALKARLKHLEAAVRIAELSRGYVEPHVWEWGSYIYVYDGWCVTVQSRIGGRILVDHEATAAFEAGRRYQQERGDE